MIGELNELSYEIEFYEDKDGHKEIEEFLLQLEKSNQKNDKSLLKKIVHQFNMLELLGNRLNEPQAKFLKGYRHPIMELRPMPERFFYASWQDNKIVMLHHYTKRQNKTDPKEVEKALKRLDDWYDRKGR
ncbi:Phage-related protein [Pilibacter termitis]|uniref:Phage-related protein n=1 Tax=Pilibacter termitis TaxID=263852 RepID=A0A1T4PA61_9ENTE|nr:type II toxin-antitoxin system RelE/ParE family toxin [Pilibacter termitis]SJZ87728.1 Phage-related protein [Pilibacter termitis]